MSEEEGEEKKIQRGDVIRRFYSIREVGWYMSYARMILLKASS